MIAGRVDNVSSIWKTGVMNITIESKTVLPYGLIPHPDYTPGMLANIMGKWMEYLVSNGAEFWSCQIVVTPDPGEAAQAGREDRIGETMWLSFQDIRSMLIMAN